MPCITDKDWKDIDFAIEHGLDYVALSFVRTAAEVRELRAYLGDRIPRWQLPERWSFIDEVPKTSVGKFKKTTLREQYAAGTLDVTKLGAIPH